MSVKKHINNVKKNGLTHIKNVFSQKEVLHFQQKSIKIMNDYENSGHSFSNHNRVLNCPFRFDDIFFKMLKAITNQLRANFMLQYKKEKKDA
ncbi:hypothetical protein OAM70_04510 [Pelagibacteraceae bacterium]|nr:hypothetical protein [Pelagibacteraceae bacterium]